MSGESSSRSFSSFFFIVSVVDARPSIYLAGRRWAVVTEAH
jgi:hypothetical protein